jgi:hypothetical protein
VPIWHPKLEIANCDIETPEQRVGRHEEHFSAVIQAICEGQAHGLPTEVNDCRPAIRHVGVGEELNPRSL